MRLAPHTAPHPWSISMGLPCSICVHCGGIHRTSPVFDAIAPAYPSKTSRGPLTRSLGMLCADSSLSAVLPQARGLRHPSSAWWRRLARPPTLTPPPLSAAPLSASRGGQVALESLGQRHGAGPYSCLAPSLSGGTGWHPRPGMPGARCPGGLCTLPVLHHGSPQPRPHLLGACLPRLGPFRRMLLTS